MVGAVSTDAVEMITIPPAEFEAMQAELRRLPLIEARAEILRRLNADVGRKRRHRASVHDAQTTPKLGLRHDRRSDRFPERTWPDIQIRPGPLPHKVVDVVFYLAQEPVASVAARCTPDDPAKEMFKLRLGADSLTN
jgi:hypothetical protein